MIETRMLYNRQGIRRILYFALTFMISLQLTGCAVGYITFHTEDWHSTQPTPNLANVKISRSYWEEHSPGFSIDKKIDGFVDRILHSRFHILDIQPTPQTGIHNETDRFVIRVKQVVEEISQPGETWLVGGYFSFAVLPAVWNEDHSVAFNIIAPGGEEKTYRYRYTERYYSWLPFLFFGPGYFAAGTTGGSNSSFYEKDRAKILEDITARFMAEAAPFILSHSARQTQ